MDRLHEIRVCVAVAEAGSFAAAGRRLRMSPPAVTRAISALEDRLGTTLFTRTTRSLAVTDSGRQFVARAQNILADLDMAEQEVAGAGAAPRGHLTVTASVTFGRAIVAPLVHEFLDLHPLVDASVKLLDRPVNLVDEGVDVAVRIGELADSAMIASRLGTVRRVLVASPAYLDRHGTPAAPADLKRHSIIAFTGLMPGREWRFGDRQRSQSIVLSPRFEINDALAALQAAEEGRGIAVALSYMVENAIRAGRLVEVLSGDAAPVLPVHVLYPQTRLVAPKVRAFVDFVAPRIRTALGGPT